MGPGPNTMAGLSQWCLMLNTEELKPTTLEPRPNPMVSLNTMEPKATTKEPKAKSMVIGPNIMVGLLQCSLGLAPR